MRKRIKLAVAKACGWFINLSITKEGLSKGCIAVLIASLLPLVLIALYNYPADDDFGYTLSAAAAWVQTRSLPAVVSAMVDTTRHTYQTWQGYFVSTFLFALNPLIFNLKLYFISNWAQLALLCLAVGYALKGVMKYYLNASRAAFGILYAALLILCLQFMPHIGYAIYWHNGGNYIVAVNTLLITLGLLIRLAYTPRGKRRAVRSVLASLCGFLLGGMFFGPALAGFVFLGSITLASLIRRSPIRWQSLATLLAFCVSFGFSLASPGNALRVGDGFVSTGAPYAILASLQEALKLTGTWLTPQLLALLLLMIPALWQPLRESRHAFSHPVLVTGMFFGVFAASLTTGIYTGVGYTFERYYNAVYLYFLIFAFSSAVYLEGALIRLLERRGQNETAGHVLAATARMGKRYSALFLSLCAALLLFGALGFTIMNTASISATRSLVTGEAAAFHQEMEARAEYIRVTDSDEVAVRPLTVAVPVFKTDKLPFQGIYGRVRYMKWYYELFYNAPQ